MQTSPFMKKVYNWIVKVSIIYCETTLMEMLIKFRNVTNRLNCFIKLSFIK